MAEPMADLYPTPTRLTLLGQVDRSQVVVDATSGESYIIGGDGGTKVTARVGELLLIGWIELPPGTAEPSEMDTWRLTAAGRRVLTTGQP